LIEQGMLKDSAAALVNGFGEYVENNITDYLTRKGANKVGPLNLGEWGTGAGGPPMKTLDETLHDAHVLANETFRQLAEDIGGMLNMRHSVGGAPGLFEVGTQEGYQALIRGNDSMLDVMKRLQERSETLLEKIKRANEGTEVTIAEIQEFLKRQPGVTS
jgi:hypothetical protein